ncbi:putative TolA protein [Sphingomonas paucimobilis]|nr:putative TolA protein [Sphingomonas paucimobilis]
MERAEKIGLGVATAGHVLLFGLLSAGFLATPNPLKLKSPPMDVSLVDEVALESMAPRVSTQPPPPSVAPEKGLAEDAAPAPAPVPEPAPAPEPEPAPAPAPPPPKPAPPKKDVPKAAPKPKPKPAPEKPASRPKPAPEKPAVKSKPAPTNPKPKAAAPAPAPSKSKATPKADAPARASGEGKAQKPRGSLLGKDFLKGIDTSADAPRTPAPPPAATMGPAQKAALNNVISNQIYPHLRLPSGADVELLVALLDVKLDRNGRVVGRPEVIDVQGVNDSNRPQVSVYKERAIQAVMQASPFQNLPSEYYDQWKWLKPLRVYARKAR